MSRVVALGAGLAGHTAASSARERKPSAPARAATRRAPVERLARRERPFRVPRAVDGAAGLFVVDATWGVIQPLQLAPGVETFGELEVIEHIVAGGTLVDCRLASYLSGGTIAGAVNLPHTEIVARSDELDRDCLTVVFCNGPQCPASNDAVNALLRCGWPPHALAYYRGGIHDWVTLGLPLTMPERSARDLAA